LWEKKSKKKWKKNRKRRKRKSNFTIIKKQKEKEQQEKLERKIVLKEISIKKKQIKKQAVLDEICDDDTPIEIIKKISQQLPKKSEQIRINQTPSYYFVQYT